MDKWEIRFGKKPLNQSKLILIISKNIKMSKYLVILDIKLLSFLAGYLILIYGKHGIFLMFDIFFTTGLEMAH